MLIRNAEINGEHCADVRIANKKITEISGSLTELTGEQIIHANGGALFPGLHDHHIHLTALAARMNSVDCGPSIVTSVEDLKQMLRNATADNTGWIRGIGYHESVAGHLNKHDLDQIVADVPIRIQHRSGRLWMMNSVGVERLLAAAKVKPVAYNEFLKTGRLADDDAWLRAITARGRPPSLVNAVQLLLSFGVTGITDTTPDNCVADLARFERAQQAGELPCKVRLMGTEKLGSTRTKHVLNDEWLDIGERKIHLSDNALPDLEEFTAWVSDAHAVGRNVAVHCVTQAELILTLTALDEAGIQAGDRIEHGSVIASELLPRLAASGLCVITQPNFIAERGDNYRQEIEQPLHDQLYRVASLKKAGVGVAFGTDAPFGNANPWLAMQAGIDRLTSSGHVLGRAEMVSPEQALAGFLSPLQAPSAPARSIVVNAPADLFLLTESWQQVRQAPANAKVATTIIDGDIVYEAASVS